MNSFWLLLRNSLQSFFLCFWKISSFQVLSHLRQQRMLMVQTVAQVLIDISRVKDCLLFKIHCFGGCKIILWMLGIPRQSLTKAHVFRDKNLHHVFVFSTSLSTPRWSTTSARAGSSDQKRLIGPGPGVFISEKISSHGFTWRWESGLISSNLICWSVYLML